MKKLRTLSIVFALAAVPAIAFAGPGAGKDKEARMAERAAMKAKFDADGDGTLNQTERAAMHEARASARFDRMDTDGDGMLSKAEFLAGAKDGKGKWHKKGKRGKGKAKKAATRRARGRSA